MTYTTGAKLLVKCLEAHDVEYVFGIPGVEVESIIDELEESSIQFIVCRHEQNAAFMAASYARLSGKPGVVLVTAGSSVSNLVTGLLTATTDGDAVIALAGNYSRKERIKYLYNKNNNVCLMQPVTKYSAETISADSIPATVENAFRCALAPHQGASFISFPQDVLLATNTAKVIKPIQLSSYGQAPEERIEYAAEIINRAKQPVILLGQEASKSCNTQAIRNLLAKVSIATTGTFQAAGVISRDLVKCFAGRVGFFENMPGDVLLRSADVVLSIGLNATEYDPSIWNPEANKKIIHLDYIPATIDANYQPVCEVLGDIDHNLDVLTRYLKKQDSQQQLAKVQALKQELLSKIESGKDKKDKPMHPLFFIYHLRQILDDDSIVICDVGTAYLWMAKYFFSFEPRHLLFSNNQQSLGVSLPWAIGAGFAKPGKKIISISGDGGFLYSAMELETAVRERHQFVHCIWRDGGYNISRQHPVKKYHPRSGVDFGRIDIPSYAKAFGAAGFELLNPNDLVDTLQHAMKMSGPVLIDIPIDYSEDPCD